MATKTAQHDTSVSTPSARVKKVRAPWLIGGGILIAVGILASVLIYMNLSQTTNYLVTTQAVARGQIIERTHLGAAPVGRVPEGVDVVTVEQFERVVGKRAVADLPQGTLMSPAMASEGAAIPDDKALVGIFVGAGEYPTANMSVGDYLSIIAVPNLGTAQTDPDDPYAIPIEVSRAEVYSIAGNSDSSFSLFVSLLIPTGDAGVVGSLIDANRVFYAQIPSLDAPSVINADLVARVMRVSEQRLAELRDATPAADEGVVPSDDFTYLVDATAGVAVIVVDGTSVEDVAAEAGLRPSNVYVDLDRDGVADDAGVELPAAFADAYETYAARLPALEPADDADAPDGDGDADGR